MKIKLNKSNISVPDTLSCHFDFNTKYNGSHRAYVYLSADGEYRMKIDGVEYSTYEPSAKRSSLYSKAIAALSNQMQLSINNYNEAFVNIAKQSVIFRSKQSIEKQIGKIELKKYSRKKFIIPFPQKEEVRDDLAEEANSKFFSIWSNRISKKQKYIDENIDEELNKRESNWQELKLYHDSIEDVIESGVNSQYQKEYNSKRKALEDIIIGDDEYVKEKISNIDSELKFPWPVDVFIDVNYIKNDKIIEAIVTLPLNFKIPEKKVVSLSSGKINVKDKLKREFDIDTSSALLGLSYYLCSKLFDITTNVKTIRLSVESSLYAYYWVEFDRDTLFNSINPLSSLEPIHDFFHHPNVIDYKKNSISPIPIDDFKIRIKDAINVAKILFQDKNLAAISISDAESLCKSLSNTPDLQKAIVIAKRNNSSMVVVNKKYVNAIRELNISDDTESESNEVTTENRKEKSIRNNYHVTSISSLVDDAARKAIKHFKYSVAMLQKDLSIDESSAIYLMQKLQNVGVVGFPDSDGFYPVLIDSESLLDFKMSWASK